MQSNYKEAANVLKKAQDQFVRIGDQLGAAQCSQSLGDIFQHVEASGIDHSLVLSLIIIYESQYLVINTLV
jgi:hypothetical protein